MGGFNFHKGVKLNEGGFVFVEGVKLSEPDYPKGVKLAEVEFAEGVKLDEPDLLIACVSLVHLVYSIFIYLHQQNSLQIAYTSHAPDDTKDNLLINTITHKHILTTLM